MLLLRSARNLPEVLGRWLRCVPWEGNSLKMREHSVQQNTPEWELLRSGIPTASEFSRIVTPTGKLSKQARDYKALLLAERVLRRAITAPKTSWMDRGSEFESAAVEFYEFTFDKKTTRIGFVTNDAGTVGASPDRWSDDARREDHGQVEIKVPAPHTHMAYFMAQSCIDACETEIAKLNPSAPRETEFLKELHGKYTEALSNCIAQEYKVQTMGQLWVTERRWADLLSFSPEGLPPVLVHLKRDEPFIEILAKSVTEFSADLERESAELVKRGVISAE